MTIAMPKAWQQAAKQLKKVLPGDDFDTWITPAFYSHHDSSKVYLSVPNKFILDGHHRFC